MSSKDVLVQGGLWGGVAQSIVAGDFASGLSAAGTTQATATPVTTDIAMFGTVALSTGAVLKSDIGVKTVFNGGANALLVYPPVGGTINAGAANASFSVAIGKSAQFVSHDGRTFVGVVSA